MKFSLGKALFLVAVATLTNGFAPQSVYAAKEILRPGTTVLTAYSPDGAARVTIRIAIFGDECTCRCPAARTLKALGLKEMLIVAGGDISVGGKSVIVPDSVLDRLFNPHKASLQFKNGTFILRVDCGDAANSYFVLIYFDAEGVNRRLDYSGEAPDKPTGDMRYFRVEIE